MFLVLGDTAVLEYDVDETPRVEVRDISKAGNHDGLGAGRIKTSHVNAAFQVSWEIMQSFLK